MKPKLIALNLVLVLAIAAIAWQARVRWNDAQATRRSHLDAVVKPVAPPPLLPIPQPDAAPAAKYLDVATNDLFSKDRNPNVVIEPPKVEVAKPMPPLPVVFGVMGLPSGTKAIMAEKKGADSKTVRSGDTIGEFQIVALDPVNVTFLWDGKQISRKIDDLIDRSGNTPPAGAPQAATGPAAPPPPPRSAAAVASNVPATAKSLGVEVGGAQKSSRACVPGDSSPAGTVVDGYRKAVTASPFGSVCRWDAVK